MNNTEKLYRNKMRNKAIIDKNYANCSSCNAINLQTPKDITYQDEACTAYEMTCWRCKAIIFYDIWT